MMTNEQDKIAQIIGQIANASTWMEAKIVDVPSYTKGYIELKLRNGKFTTIIVKNPYEAEVRIASFGGFKSIISTNEVISLLNKLSH